MNVAISPKFLEKMANDPALAAEYEKNIAAMKDCDERVRQMQAARTGSIRRREPEQGRKTRKAPRLL